MKHHYRLNFDIQSYWHIGDGRESGVYADDVVRKNKGLPFIPGTSIRGLLADAFKLAETNKWFGKYENIAAVLFGEGGNDGINCQGLLQVTNAAMSGAEIAYFEANPTARGHLYQMLASTAISDKGVAKDKSLRTIEVTVPMQLKCEITINLDHPKLPKHASWLTEHFETWLEQVLSLLTEIGGSRNRGLGKVCVSIDKQGA